MLRVMKGVFDLSAAIKINMYVGNTTISDFGIARLHFTIVTRTAGRREIEWKSAFPETSWQKSAVKNVFESRPMSRG